MKKCPHCHRTYSDETLSFCLEDGALLSASYNLQETNAPTFLINAVNIPTVNAREVPTVVAEKWEVPPLVNSFRPMPITENVHVGWKIYLAGIIIAIVADSIFYFVIAPIYGEATRDIFTNIRENFNDVAIGYNVATFIVSIPFNVVYYTIFSFLLGFIWSRASWRWGIIAVIPGVIVMLYYLIMNLAAGSFSPLYILRIFISTLIYLTVACLSASLGSRLSFNKPTA